MKQFVDFGQASAELLGFKLQQAFPRLCGVALRVKIYGLLR